MKLVSRPISNPVIEYEYKSFGTLRGIHIFTPKQRKATGALLWIHGGGLVIGSAAQDQRRCMEFAERLGCVVVSVDYRLAPEYPFPAPLDDCLYAWNWLQNNAEERDIKKDHIIIAGQSAGGGLAACLVQRVHDQQDIQPIAQVLFCPMLDDRTINRHELDSPSHYLWNNKANRFGWRSYLGTKAGKTSVPRYGAAARRGDYGGLAPAWIGVGNVDLFYDESKVYAQSLQDSDVSVKLEVVPGAPHGFESLRANTPVAKKYIESALEWMEHYLR